MTSRLIFVVGNSRSGTTMLGRILGAHSAVHTFGELHFFEQMVDAEDLEGCATWSRHRAVDLAERLLTRARDGFFAPFQAGVYRDDAEALVSRAGLAPADIYAALLYSEAARFEAVIPCEQTPRYIFFSEEILALYPGTRIVNMIRDPRDVVLSQRSKWRRRFLGARGIPLSEALRAWANYHPWLVSRLWVSCVEQADAINSDRFTSIRFEDLLSQPETVVRSLCDFLELPFEPSMLQVPRVGSSSGRDDPERRGIDGSRAGGWRHSSMRASTRQICEWTCREAMRRHGYGDLERDGRPTLRGTLLMTTLPLKLMVAVPLNVRRFASLAQSIRRRLTSSRARAN